MNTWDRNYSRATEKFRDAVRGAVIDRHSLQERLYRACTHHLSGVLYGGGAEEDWVPPEIRGEFAELREIMVREVSMHDDPESSARSALSDEEAFEWLQRMVSMFERIVKYGQRDE